MLTVVFYSVCSENFYSDRKKTYPNVIRVCIFKQLVRAQVFHALLSPDFVASLLTVH